nr:putative transposase [Ipomoea batatas]
MLFKIAVRKEQIDNLHYAFGVLSICRYDLKVSKYNSTLSLEQDHDDHKMLSDCFGDEEFESLRLQRRCSKEGEKSGAIKRSLMEDFSTSVTSKRVKRNVIKKKKM